MHCMSFMHIVFLLGVWIAGRVAATLLAAKGVKKNILNNVLYNLSDHFRFYCSCVVMLLDVSNDQWGIFGSHEEMSQRVPPTQTGHAKYAQFLHLYLSLSCSKTLTTIFTYIELCNYNTI